MQAPFIEVKDLTKYYGNFRAVDNLTFHVNQGDIYGFLGPNGAGKSTTLRMLLTLIRPSSGSIRFFNSWLSGNRRMILGRIGSIVERPDFYNYLSARMNLEFFGNLNERSISRRKIYELLDLVGLNGREEDKVREYSHGMKQRLGIAQALLHDPEIIILDEPTTGLDPEGIINIRNLLKNLRDEKAKTILISSHILSEIELVANSMVIINKGKLVAEGRISDLLSTDEMVVTFRCSPASAFKSFLDNPEIKQHLISYSDTEMVLKLSMREIPRINSFLVEKGLEITGIDSKRKLEDYFLKLVRDN